MNGYLIDTQVLIWALGEPKKLTRKMRTVLESVSDLFVSAATTWELAIKTSTGRLKLPVELAVFAQDAMDDIGFNWLPIQVSHTMRVQALPWHHRDPFDRLLAAQAVAEDLTLLSTDRIFDKYGCSRVG